MKNLPTIAELSALIRDLEPEILEDYRASGCEDDRTPSMDLTIGWTPEDGSWDYQTGDNSCMGDAYGHTYWAVTIVDRRSNSRGVARDIIEQLADQLWS